MKLPVHTNLNDLRQEFRARGVSIAAWARSHGYSPQLVYQVLAGRTVCSRGQSHAIAVALGLKRGVEGSLEELDQVLAERRIAASGQGSRVDTSDGRSVEGQPMT